MTDTLAKVYIGWDGRDWLASQVAHRSLLAHASNGVEIVDLFDHQLRKDGHYWRTYRVDSFGQKRDDIDRKPFSTEFSFTRHLVPHLEDYSDRLAIFTDPDVLWRGDVYELLSLCADESKSVWCVPHEHRPPELEKALGVQTHYPRKNWSSVMVFRPSLCRALTHHAVSNRDGLWLQTLGWAGDDEIGKLPEEWNWLEGWSPDTINPKIVHYTRGTPDMAGYEDAPYADEWRTYTST